MHEKKLLIAAAALSLSVGLAQAGDVVLPNTFVAGTPAKAADVNANFDALTTAVNGNSTALSALQTTVKAIPAGAVGPQGPAGPSGASGPPGLPGAMGPQGVSGPQGTAGASGAAGDRGAAGPAGPAGPAAATTVPVVMDANNTVLGAYTPGIPGSGNLVVMHAPAGGAFQVGVSATQFSSTSLTSLMYLSADCTGTAYVSYQGGVLPLALPAAVVATSAYLLGSALGYMTPGSFAYTNTAGGAACQAESGYGFPSEFYTVSAIVDLSSYVAPFRAQ